MKEKKTSRRAFFGKLAGLIAGVAAADKVAAQEPVKEPLKLDYLNTSSFGWYDIESHFRGSSASGRIGTQVNSAEWKNSKKAGKKKGKKKKH